MKTKVLKGKIRFLGGEKKTWGVGREIFYWKREKKESHREQIENNKGLYYYGPQS
jgi:hypothetical protein